MRKTPCVSRGVSQLTVNKHKDAGTVEPPLNKHSGLTRANDFRRNLQRTAYQFSRRLTVFYTV